MENNTPFPNIIEAIFITMLYLVLLFIFMFLIRIFLSKSSIIFIEGIATLLSGIMFTLMIPKTSKSDLKQFLSFKSFSLWTFISLLCIVLGMLILSSEIINVLQIIFNPAITPSQNGSLLVSTIVGAGIVPIVEETIFRGTILLGFLKRYSMKKSLLFSSVIFAIGHLSLLNFIHALIGGLIFGWVFIKTKSLFYCIFCHATANFLLITAKKLPLSIQGFNSGVSPIFQPLWFDMTGIFLFIIGVYMLVNITNKEMNTKAPM